MADTKHILNENGVKQTFKLVVGTGDYAGTYNIIEPDGWSDFDCIVDVNEEFFNVDNFIIGKEIDLRFIKYSNPVAYDVIKNVYNEQGGDANILFKWIVEKDSVQIDLLDDRFELNLNVYEEGFEQSNMYIQTQLKSRESEDKMLTREDVSVDLFDLKSLDDELVVPFTTSEVGIKMFPVQLTNLYFLENSVSSNPISGTELFLPFRASQVEFGIVDTGRSGMDYITNIIFPHYYYTGVFLYADVPISGIMAEFSNLHVRFNNSINSFPVVTLIVKITQSDGTLIGFSSLKPATNIAIGGINYSEINIVNETFPLGTLQQGLRLEFFFQSNDGSDFYVTTVTNNTSITLNTETARPLIKTQGVFVRDMLDRICDLYTSGNVSLQSSILGNIGNYGLTIVSTGSYLRGLPPLYTPQKLKTSLNQILKEGISPLMALGYDISGDKLIVENVEYFFKRLKCYDLTDKPFVETETILSNDIDLTYNELQFGSNKYSTKNKYDILNFNTKANALTPIVNRKQKFDKAADIIIDQFKIDELIQDKSTATNDNDDDLALIDMVSVSNEFERAVFINTLHSIVSGYLALECSYSPFDQTFISVGMSIKIEEGLNIGTYTVLSVNGNTITVNKTTGIQVGKVNTTISYTIANVVRNRTTQGFTNISNVKYPTNSINLRHTPKHQLARWFSFYGSALSKKSNSDIIKITDYKNNKNAKMEIVPDSYGLLLANEIQGEIIVGDDETLNRLRTYKQPLFDGRVLSVKLERVEFWEFWELFNNWKYGQGGNRNLSRGFVSVNTQFGVLNVYPFGDGALQFNRSENTLTINGKVGRMYPLINPSITGASISIGGNLAMSFNIPSDFNNYTIQVQMSTDGGLNYNTIEELGDVTTAILDASLFTSIISGQEVYFKIIVEDSLLLGYSDPYMVTWTGNDWVVFESNREVNINCIESILTLNISGNEVLDLTADITSSEPSSSGGELTITDEFNNVIYNGNTGYTGTINLTTGVKVLNFKLETQKLISVPPVGMYALDCSGIGTEVYTLSWLKIDIEGTTKSETLLLSAGGNKYY